MILNGNGVRRRGDSDVLAGLLYVKRKIKWWGAFGTPEGWRQVQETWQLLFWHLFLGFLFCLNLFQHIRNAEFVSPRSVREGLPDMWWTKAEEAENNNQEKHTQPCLQRSHHLRHSPGECGTSQSVHYGDGLWSVSHTLTSYWTVALNTKCCTWGFNCWGEVVQVC